MVTGNLQAPLGMRGSMNLRLESSCCKSKKYFHFREQFFLWKLRAHENVPLQRKAYAQNHLDILAPVLGLHDRLVGEAAFDTQKSIGQPGDHGDVRANYDYDLTNVRELDRG